MSWKNRTAVVHTDAAPPRNGSTIFPTIGWKQKRRNALSSTVAASRIRRFARFSTRHSLTACRRFLASGPPSGALQYTAYAPWRFGGLLVALRFPHDVF